MEKIHACLKFMYRFALHLPKQCCIRLCWCSLVTERLCQHSRQVRTSASLLAIEEDPTTNNNEPHLEEDVCSLSGLSCGLTEVALGTEGFCKKGSLKLEQ